MRAIIGLVSKHNEIKSRRTVTFISDEMKNAIFSNGGIAIGIIPSTKIITLVNSKEEYEIFKHIDQYFTEKEKSDLIQQINMCDGIILSGGKESDAYEIWIARYCYDNDIPILGICAGHNNLVRSVGGRTKEVENPQLHNQPNLDYVHSIDIDKTSKFFTFVNVENMKVNSRHKNTIADPAHLSVAAYDEFGNIEVTEDKLKKCFLGMRFHPESLYLNDEIHNRIFKKFIEICNKK